MFLFAADGRVRWPVTVQQVQPDGSSAEVTITVTYKRLDRDELRARTQAQIDLSTRLASMPAAEQAGDRMALLNARIDADDALLRERVVGWSGIANAGGTELPYSPELRDALIADALLRKVLLDGLIEASEGAREKNSQPGLAGLPAVAQG